MGREHTIGLVLVLLVTLGAYQGVSSQGVEIPAKDNEQKELQLTNVNLVSDKAVSKKSDEKVAEPIKGWNSMPETNWKPSNGNEELKRQAEDHEASVNQTSKRHKLSVDRPKIEDTFDATISIADRPECQSDLEASQACKEILRSNSNYRKNTLALISCLLSPDNEAESQGSEPRTLKISNACENMVWKYEVALTQNKAITNKIRSACKENEKDLQPCLSVNATDTPANQGHILGCIMARKDDPLIHWVESCKAVINQVEALVFSDYHLIGGFVEKCGADIDRLECGRGDVLACLSASPKKLSPVCKKEIFAIAEYQSEDYHLDRRLFLACQKNRREICSDVRSGNGEIYKCLMKKKFDPKMTKSCQRQLTRRQKLIALDFKASKGIYKSCKKEVKENRCFEDLSSNVPQIQLSEVLICLENVANDKKDAISPLCLSEVETHRKMIMEDYRISPEIMLSCKDDIQTSCADEGPGGNTIHCLMKNAAHRELQSQDCLRAVQMLMKASNVGSNWKVDPVLRKNCQDVVNSGCSQENSNGAVVSCLMTLAGENSRHMTQECMGTLMEVQYFLARDFSLTPKLYSKCLSDAKKLCFADENWGFKANRNDVDELDDRKLIFPCLVRHLYPEDVELEKDEVELTDACADQVVKVLEQRAISVNLHPEIEENCRGHLVYLCNNKTQDGAEFHCLQENFQSLDEECQESVRTNTKIQAKNTRLNAPVMISCHEVIEAKCKDDLKRNDNGYVMRCLIRYKLEHEDEQSSLMTRKCSVMVEHWQILTMKDWHFSTKFKNHCQESVNLHCQPVPQSKLEVLRCLSNIIQQDFITNSVPRIPKACRMELKFNLLQKHSDIKLNPNLAKNCYEELGTVCENDRTLECLKSQPHEDLTPSCRQVVFRQEKEEVMMNSLDHTLTKVCGNEIKTHCSETNGEPNAILNCLKENQSSLNFDRACRGLVIQRIVQQMKDYRLNPRLQQACARDLPDHCAHVMLVEEKKMADDFMEGKVIECLKDRLRSQRDTLTVPCQKEVKNLMRQSSVDIRAKPLIMQKCPLSVQICHQKLGSNNDVADEDGQIEDSRECMQELAKTIEDERQDINMDTALHRRCGVDAAKFCHDSVSQLLEHVSNSPSRNHFFLVGLLLVGIIFLVGIMCGRTTRRLRQELKS
ncbi:hypothetical protein TCAL_13427, partial [Tigriopus californicus]|eukprot:TCALIF_13427-PA protein Name:"Similar to GLG1 Golgi apparatus protein 1 (Homo sapiens)" AED:0.08 eAED:0.08 QI:76/0.75/0.76/0.94/0.81/0.82/17/0/1157